MKHFPRPSQKADPATPFPTARAPRVTQPRVEILMRLFDGAGTLRAELDHLTRQEHQAWALSIRDDGSRDDGVEIARAFAADHPGRDIRICGGAHRGPARGVVTLFGACDASSDYVAVLDPGDRWDPARLSRAIATLSKLPPGVPALYCGRVASPRALASAWPRTLRRPPGFRNALVDSIAPAGTMVVNRTAASILGAAAAHPGPFPDHGWWIYQVISGAGGSVIRDERATLVRETPDTFAVPAGVSGLCALASGRFARWTDQNTAALMSIAPLLTKRSRETIMDLLDLRTRPPLQRLQRFGSLGLYRQTRAGQAALWAAATAGRL